MLKLYYSPGACSLAPHILLEETGLAYSAEAFAIAEGRHLDPDYARINPRLRVPALETSWGILTEASAILCHVGELVPDAGYLPAPGSRDRARLHEMMSWLGTTLHATAYGGLWRPGRFHPAPDQVADGMARTARETIADCHQQIEAGLGDFYALGDYFTVLDPYLYVFYRWGCRVGFDLAGGCPRWTDWARLVEHRISVRAVLAREGLPALTGPAPK